uniref:Uncharacterized protein n=1 Tax=Parascaris equorum TaxID=6256 RepID=A0A914RPD0_PAREQ
MLSPIAEFTATDMMRGIDQPTFAEIAPLIRDLWDDQAIKHTYDQRNLFQISTLRVRIFVTFVECDSCIYFFEHINRVSMPDYYPTNRDILFCRKATRGITEHIFEIQRIPFRLELRQIASVQDYSEDIIQGETSSTLLWERCSVSYKI